jgi:hypothetical protein
MIRLLFDENFNNDILRGMLRRNPSLDILRVQDHGLRGASDEVVLEWAARNECVVISHDVTTLSKHAYDRVKAGVKMPGMFQVPRSVAISNAIEDLVLIAECSEPGEWNGQVRYLPLR